MNQSTITAQEEVECPECGKTVYKRGLGSHQNSQPCIIRQHQQIQEEEDLTPVAFMGGSQVMAEYLKEHDYPCKELLNNKGTEKYYTSQEGREAVRENILRNPQVRGNRAEIVKELQNGYFLCNGKENNSLSRRYNEYEGLFIVEKITNVDMSRKRVVYINLRSNRTAAFTSDGLKIGPIHSIEDSTQLIDLHPADIVSTII